MASLEDDIRNLLNGLPDLPEQVHVDVELSKFRLDYQLEIDSVPVWIICFISADGKAEVSAQMRTNLMNIMQGIEISEVTQTLVERMAEKLLSFFVEMVQGEYLK